MVEFPDHSAQEEMIHVIGNAELLWKGSGVNKRKILRYGKSTWGRSEDDLEMYKMLKPYATGRVLNVGLGMGTSAEKLLEKTEITEFIAYELEGDIISMYNWRATPDGRTSILQQDAHVHKPTGNFDVILYELQMNSQEWYDQAKVYLQWAYNHLTPEGLIILPHNRFSEALVREFLSLLDVTVLTKETGKKPTPIWIICAKK